MAAAPAGPASAGAAPGVQEVVKRAKLAIRKHIKIEAGFFYLILIKTRDECQLYFMGFTNKGAGRGGF